MSGWRRTFARFTTLVVATAGALVAAELFVRTVDGYTLASVTLVRDAHAATRRVDRKHTQDHQPEPDQTQTQRRPAITREQFVERLQLVEP